MAVAFWVYGLVMAPMGILIGVATATIGFTAWGIVVPLVWIGLGGGRDDGWMYFALFTSIFMDFINGLVLTVLYAASDNIKWKKGLIFGIPACGIAIGCIFASKVALEYFKNEIKKGLGYVVIIIGLTFVIRGYTQWKKQKELEEKQVLLPEQGAAESPLPFSDDKESGVIKSVRNSVRGSYEDIETEPWSTEVVLRYAAMSVVTVASSCLSGLLGMGSGTNFILAFLYLLKFDLIVATGTGVLIMTGLMFSMSVCYLLGVMPAVNENISWLWPYFVLPSGFGIIGTFIGVFFSMKISPLKMNFVIAFLLVCVGLIAVIEPHVIPVDDEK